MTHKAGSPEDCTVLQRKLPNPILGQANAMLLIEELSCKAICIKEKHALSMKGSTQLCVQVLLAS